MTALRTYAQELAAVEAVLRPRRVEAREWARPDAWSRLGICLTAGDGYCICGIPAVSNRWVFVGGNSVANCHKCGRAWAEHPCKHQLGLAALWAGGHPIQLDAVYFNHEFARELEGGSR